MDKKNQSEIGFLKEKLYRLEQAYQEHDLLVSQREKLYFLIAKKQTHLEQLLYQLSQVNDPHSFNQQTAQIKKEGVLIRELKEKQKDLDHQLDAWEEMNPEDLDRLQEELVNSILKVYPEYQEFYQQHQQQLQHIRELESQFYQLKETLVKLHSHLETVIRTRQSIKGRGLLNYIFGFSPNRIIEKEFQECSRLIDSTLPFLIHSRQENSHSNVEAIYAGIQLFLQNLHPHFKALWGFRKIDTLFTQAMHQLDQKLIALENERQQITQQRKNLEEENENWLQSF
jgi:hypothetical protein